MCSKQHTEVGLFEYLYGEGTFGAQTIDHSACVNVHYSLRALRQLRIN